MLGAGGVIVPPPTYWPKLRELLDRYDILLIADEVVTAFGRTGNWFGSRGWGVKPDMMCIAKAITSGYFPFGACVVNARIEEAFRNNNDMLGAIFHGYTYSGHPAGCAAALACIDETFKLRPAWQCAGRGRLPAGPAARSAGEARGRRQRARQGADAGPGVRQRPRRPRRRRV